MKISDVIHRIGVLIGVLVLAAGTVLLFVPGVATTIPFNLLVADVASLGALILGFWVIRTRYRTTLTQTVVPDVEYQLLTPTPGDEIDNLIYRMTMLREGTIQIREQIHERIENVAATVIANRHGCSHEDAIALLNDGSWTENDLAASFFGATGRGGRSSSLVDQLQSRFTDKKSAYERQLLETVTAIESVGDALEGTDEGVPENGTRDDDAESPRAMAPIGFGSENDGEQITDTVRYRSLLRTHHWTGISAFALIALAVGIIGSQPALILGSAVGIALAGYARVGTPPPLSELEVTRTVSDESPSPGDEIDVTVTVENTGSSFFADLKLIDRIPPMMRVVDGSARLGTVLRPGRTATFRYTLVVERGDHTWPLQVIGRDVSGAIEREAYIEPETMVSCVPPLVTTAEMPVRLQTSVYAGEVETRTGGEGLEFYSVRDYQPGDPKRRIDWKTYARTREFTTIDFREEHAARVVLLFDARSSSYVSRSPGEKHAMDQSIEAGFDAFASLYDQGHLIGIAAFNGIPCWLGPNTGQLHLQRVRRLFVEHPALTPLPPSIAEKEEGRYVDPMIHIRRQLPQNTQIFLFSPLTDHYTYEVARRLNGAGHLVTVISPDPTAKRTVGQRIARLERSVRIKQLRDHGIRVVDWNTDRSLPLELEQARRRWKA